MPLELSLKVGIWQSTMSPPAFSNLPPFPETSSGVVFEVKPHPQDGNPPSNRQQWRVEGGPVVAMLQQRALQTVTYAVSREGQEETRVIFRKEGEEQLCEVVPW